MIPPPAAKLATEGSDAVEPATLSVIIVFVTISVPALLTPAPAAKAHTWPQSGTAVSGDALFPVMTLSEIDTVAPVVLPVPGGIHTPPPLAANGSGAESLNPPVMVTR